MTFVSRDSQPPLFACRRGGHHAELRDVQVD